MEEKLHRHSYLVKILGEGQFQSQEQIVREMTVRGFEVTQSSISRDFKEIGIIKIGGIYRPAEFLKGDAKKSPFQKMIRSIDSAGSNLVVIKTTTGAAAAVAEEIDVEFLDGVVGTVAGDNTIFVATKNKSAQVKVIEKVKAL